MPTSVDCCCCCCCQVCQSALALLGHVLKYETGPTEPDVGVFLDIVQLRLEDESARAAAKTRANALWALVHAVDNRSVSDDRLLTFTDQLIATVKRTDDHPGSSTFQGRFKGLAIGGEAGHSPPPVSGLAPTTPTPNEIFGECN